MQHIEQRAQIAIKQRVLEDSLWHIGKVRPERMLRPIGGPSWRYRYRARLSVRDIAKKGGVLVGFHGTDTHGLKAFRRDKLSAIAQSCLTDKDVFASEFVIRAYREELRVLEIPIRVVEKRPPSINLLKRVPNVIKNIGKLTWAIRVRG